MDFTADIEKLHNLTWLDLILVMLRCRRYFGRNGFLLDYILMRIFLIGGLQQMSMAKRALAVPLNNPQLA